MTGQHGTPQEDPGRPHRKLHYQRAGFRRAGWSPLAILTNTCNTYMHLTSPEQASSPIPHRDAISGCNRERRRPIVCGPGLAVRGGWDSGG